MEKDELLMIQGFNAGYILEQYSPELAKTLMVSLTGVDEAFITAFLAGVKEFAAEAMSKEASKELDFSMLYPGVGDDLFNDLPENPGMDKTKDRDFEIEL